MIGKKLHAIDVEKMIDKNEYFLSLLEKAALKNIYDAYDRFKNEVDVVLVNYSGGKDSIVILDLLKRILMPGEFIVVYADTGMVFDDTNIIAEEEKKKCEENGIKFYIVKPEFDMEDLWKKIGPPSLENRWCCSISKTTPVTMFLKKFTDKVDFKCLSYQGNRALEGVGRSKQSLLTYAQKYVNRIACNAILDWSSLEVYLYIFKRKLTLNPGYRKGLKRIGCMTCPMQPLFASRDAYRTYRKDVEKWNNIIVEALKIDKSDVEKKKYFINSQKWCSRKGNDGNIYKKQYFEYIKDLLLNIEFEDPANDWKVWIKTIGILIDNKNYFTIDFKGRLYNFSYNLENNRHHIILLDESALEDKDFINLFKIVFRKATYCIGCHTCEINCVNGYMKMENGKVTISDDCKHCSMCNTDKHICYVYLSKHSPSEVL